MVNPSETSFTPKHSYLKAVFLAVNKANIEAKLQTPLELVIKSEDIRFTEQCIRSSLQEPSAIKQLKMNRELVNLLIDDQGNLLLEQLKATIGLLKEYLYPLGLGFDDEYLRREHVLKVLEILCKDNSLQRFFKTLTKPFNQPISEQIIRATLLLKDSVVITDVHIRRAVLCAWICYLRQSVGSCFATAPAILLQTEQPHQFLKDIVEILNTGRLKRTYAGLEYIVPLSVSWGAGDLKRPLKVYIDRKKNKITPLWLSPGLLHAISILNIAKESPQVYLEKRILNLLKPYLSRGFVYLTAEQLLEGLLQKHYQIDELDLQRYRNRPKNVLQSGLIQISENNLNLKDKMQVCQHYYIQLNRAKEAFKSIADNALLKTWEYTLASFAENKAGFTRWNLYLSLGLNAEEPGGIGQYLYQRLNEKLQQENRSIQEIQDQYDQVYTQIKYLETRIQSASETEAQWFKAEYQSLRNEFYTYEEIRNKHHYRASVFSNLLNLMINFYDVQFPKFFQEVYDADMHEVSQGLYDDSPAGFRLIFKHGRSNASQWSFIYTTEEFIQALINFFHLTENELLALDELQGFERDVTELLTGLMGHLQSKEFIDSAFARIAIANRLQPVKNPLEHLDKIDKKPWAYTSGGTMETLVATYFRRDHLPKIVSKWVESPMELFVFIVDTLKTLPHKEMTSFQYDSSLSMLMHSPTHAFLLKPGFYYLRQAWENESFTYTWIRDHLVMPRQEFVGKLYLFEQDVTRLIELLADSLPPVLKGAFQEVVSDLRGPLRVDVLRILMLEKLNRWKKLQNYSLLSTEQIDSLLYESLPFTSRFDLPQKIENIFKHSNLLSVKETDALKRLIEQMLLSLTSSVISAKEILELCKALLCQLTSKLFFHKNVVKILQTAMQDLGYTIPAPLCFADTNWQNNWFAFIVNPGTNQLELWRIDAFGVTGYPMQEWKEWLDGSRTDREWGIYTQKYEYL